MWSSSVALSRRDYICSWIFIQVLGFPGRRARGPDLRIGGVWRRGRSPGCATGARNMSVGAPLGRDEALPVTPIAPKCRSEEHTSELQSLMRISYAVFCLKKKTNNKLNTSTKNKHLTYRK